MTSPSFHQLRQAGALLPAEAPITLFVCGTPASAPSWWRPGDEMGPLEAAWIDSICSQQEQEVLELLAVEDRAARLLDGPCDGCQEPCTLALVEVAGEALCPGCAEASGLDYASAVEQARAPGRVPGPGWFDPEAA
jgi:hypothetical protein